MSEYKGAVVRAEAGRDEGGLFFVVGEEAPYLLLADGKRRRAARPKRKKRGHVTPLEQPEFYHPAIEKLKQDEPVSDRELRRALAAFKEGMKLG